MSRISHWTSVGALSLLGMVVVTASSSAESRRPAVFAWSLDATRMTQGGQVDRLRLTSQQWRGGDWTHDLCVYQPTLMRHPDHVLLFITGGANGKPPDDGDDRFGMTLASLCQARVAVLHQVPNQPLLGDRYEDDLIAETFERFLETGEEDWPLLLPMVESARAAMTALEQHGADKGAPVKGFVVTGASKRGWTTWLTAAGDPRVIGIAPMVIPTLKMKQQSEYQLESWGRFSQQIRDYVDRGLMEQFDTPRGKRLWSLVDPYFRLDQIRVPIFQINGTNDPYWTLDSLNLYWDEIQAPKYVVYLPNAGHGLDQNQEYAREGVAAFFRLVVTNRAFPRLTWTAQATEQDGVRLTCRSDPGPKSARMWTASAPTRDFRKALWTSQELEPGGRLYATVLRPLPDSYQAAFADLAFEIDGLELHLSTQIQVQDPLSRDLIPAGADAAAPSVPGQLAP